MTNDEDHIVPPAAAEVGLNLSREEFLLLVSECRRAFRTADRLGAAAIIGAFMVCAGLVAAAERAHLPALVSWSLFAATWAAALTTLALSRRHARRLMRRYELQCPECHAPLVDKLFGGSRVEEITATGRCSRCDAKFLAG